MKRREFLRRAVPVTTLPFLLHGLPLRAYGRSPLLESMIGAATATDRVLVLVQLGGGNDGLNTVISLDQYSEYMGVRQNIAIPEPSVLPLTQETGLHPAMEGMRNLFVEEKLAIVQGVTYPNPDLSHFRATDIWLTAANSDEHLATGWLGRYLGGEFAGYPEEYPNEVMPDPLAIQIGAVTSLALQGSTGPMGISLQNPDTFYQLANSGNQGGEATPPQTPAGRELSYIQQVWVQSQEYASQVKIASDKSRNLSRSNLYPAPGQNYLADQLRIVATLVAGGLKTRIYIVNLYGFDNHSSQVENGDTTRGIHSVLLGRLSAAIAAFQDDLRILRLQHRVLGMTFSEFGRRVYSNSSLGTDHGTAAPMFFFGEAVKTGIVGKNPSLTDLTKGNLKMQFDFRSAYASVLNQWFGKDPAELSSVLMQDFPSVPVIRQRYYIDSSGNRLFPPDTRLFDNYPNPFNSSTVISYELPDEGDVVLEVYDIAGRRVSTLVNQHENAGRHEVRFSASSSLSSGVYILQMRAGSFIQRKKMMLLR